MQLSKYNATAQKVYFGLSDPDTGDYIDTTTISAVDLKALMKVGKDSAASASAGGTLSYLDYGVWEYTPSQTETACKVIRVAIIDTQSPKRFIDEVTTVYTQGTNAAKIWLDLETLWASIVISKATNVDNLNSAAIKATSFQANAIGNTAIADAAITATKFATDAIQTATIKDNTITAAKLAADCITDSEIATSAITEIVNAIWANGTRSLTAGVNVTSVNGVAAAAALLAKMYSGAITTGAIPSTWAGATTGVHGLTTPDTDAYKDSVLVWLTGANAGHTGQHVSANDATTITVSTAFKNTPQSGDEFIIIGRSVS